MAKHPNYELFEELGRGENSTVYRAWDLALSRDVAIKELSSDPGSDGGIADAKRVKQFLDEASFLAQFEHENVLRIHTVEQDRGWIVMELMKGSLESQIASEPMQPDTVRSVLRQMLNALEFLHQKDKVHGAVRPSNILINEHGTVKLSDFEASSRDGELRAPQGSKKYLAPELIRSEFGSFGPAADLYCLGFTALELLTGAKFDSLFSGTGAGAIDADVAWLRSHSSDDPMKPVKEIAPHVPDDLANVIDQLLQKQVEDRPQNAAQVLKLLNDAPLVPVQVIPVAAKITKAQDVDAILPSKAVKLRQAAPKKKPVRQKTAAATKSQKDKLNETLGKPYVLWPICIGLLVGALLIGLQLRGDRDAVADNEPPTIVEPVINPVAIDLRITPDKSDAKLRVGGKETDLENIQLLPGKHDIEIKKEGFETYTASIEIDDDNRVFEVLLKAKELNNAVAGNGGSDKTKPVDPVDPTPEPMFIDVRVAVTPANADVFLRGERVQLGDDRTLRLTPEEAAQLRLEARADGYESRTANWTLAELMDANYDVQISLDKMPAEVITVKTRLPASLVAKPDAEIDEPTGLPLRAFARLLQDSAPLELALVVPGTYQFGVREGEPRSWELPAELVEIASPFYIGIDEVTQAQYLQSTGATEDDADGFEATEFPITNISVRQAATFCSWVGGRLPTEREWEAAVRGPLDTGFPLPWGDGGVEATKCKLFRGEADTASQPYKTGMLTAGANPIGLLNTIGNVSEWCDDQQGTDRFIIKGCSYRIPPGNHIRVTWRNVSQWSGANDIGMRLLVPVEKETRKSAALAFEEPTNIDTLLVSTNTGDQEATTQKAVYTKTVKEIADEFTGPAELVIDSGGFMDEITSVSFSPDGNRVAVAGGKVVRIWDVNTGALVTTLRGDISRTSYGNVNAVAWSPDGKFLLAGVNDYRQHGNIRVYSTDNLDEIAEVLKGHTAPCRKLSFSRNGKMLVSVDSDGLAVVRDWTSREIVQQIPVRDRDKPIYDVMSFPTDEPVLLGVDFGGPQIFSAMTGQRLGARDDMPDKVRGWLVDIYNNLVNLPYGEKVQPRVMDFRMEEGRWAGAGSATVEGRSKFWIRIWESRAPVSSKTPAREIAGYDKHRWNVTALALQPGGPMVVSGDKFGEVHVWDSTTGERKFKFAGQGKPIYEVAFEENSSRLAFGLRPFTPKDWKRNNHGSATQILNLRERSIADVAMQEELTLINEQPRLGDASLRVRKNEAHFLVELLQGTQLRSNYRMSSGNNPTTYTLLNQPKLGVDKPAIFGSDQGLLAFWDTASDELKRAFIGHGSLVSAISPASNGKLIATSSTDRTIRLWSLENHVPTGIFDFKFENSAVREVIPGSSSANAGVKVGDRIISVDGKSLTEMFELMLVGKFDYKPGQTVTVKMKRDDQPFEYPMVLAEGYDFSEPILNFYMGNDGQWIIWHPKGYYDASPGADRLIGWHLNRGYDKSAKFFEVQQFSKQLYRPDVIDGILEKGSLERALAGLEKKSDEDDLDFRDPNEIAENHPPGVKITWPTDSWQTEAATVTVKGEARSVNGLPITALTLLHNGSVAKVFRPTQVNQLEMKIEHEMQLKPGANDLVLIAANAKSSSQGEHIVVALKRPADTNRPNASVLVIGVSEFENDLPKIPSAGNDAQAFAAAMKSHENGVLYNNVKTKLLTEKATSTQILDSFQWLSENTNDGDVAMVYIASHAVVDRRDNFYIAASNTDESKARSTAVSWRDLMDTLQLDLPDCKRMVFLDLAPSKNAIKPGLRNPLLDLAAPEMGTIFLSSNTLQQQPVPLATPDKGAFLSAVLDTVADRKFDTTPNRGDALLNPVELANGVKTRVKDLTQDKQQAVFFTPEFAKLANVLEFQK